MNAHTARARRVGVGVTTFGAVAGAIVLAAPQAGAWPSDLQVSGGSSHNVGCSYTLTATLDVDRLLSVSFRDNGTELTGSPVTPSILTGKATLSWTPTTAGSHTLTVTQDLFSKSITVQVDPASSFGSFGCGLNGLLPSLSG
ncbi:Ig-like domain repeat protein [Nocardia niigatensis]|uniref:Ig-like domain repeat protein n=1 Tax=Nocardia niigatensis TaxID=209249 RepID=UPI0002FB703B|nr:Ig-like domain repeat protein [Nocardia niigatensis]